MTELNDIAKLVEQTTMLDQIQGMLDAHEAELDKTENELSAGGIEFGTKVANAVLQSPKLLAAASAGIQAPFSDKPGGFFSRAEQLFEEESGKFPANLATTVQDVGAATRAFGRELAVTSEREPDRPGFVNPEPRFNERFGPTFDEEFADIKGEEARVKARFPKSVGIGGFGGDVASIFLARKPFLGSIGKAESFLAGKKFADAIKNPGIAGEFGNIAKGFADSKAVRSLLRGGGRTIETGLEALVLEAINGDDPVQAAAWAAGAQGTGSALIKASRGLTSGGPMKVGVKLALSGLATFGFLQTMKEGLPGDDNPIVTIEQSYEKVALLLAAGGVSTLMGAGRARPGDTEKYKRVAEFFSTMPRASMLSFLTSYIEAPQDEQETVDAILLQINQDPEFFGAEITERLQKAFDEGTLLETLREEL